LLLRWNERTNLTAIREPEEIVRRHFGESLFAAAHLATRLQPAATLLDFGSGAGFPGLPIQLLLPHLRVTLAESQNKKSTFLREVVRTLELPTEVWPARVETMPPARQFDAVTLRAVDHMQSALSAAHTRVASGGWLVTLSTEASPQAECLRLPGQSPGWLTLSQRLSA
jgi:16S rRNA (guanine527-N7)-methyltransferase